jgi:hypothetical protein
MTLRVFETASFATTTGRAVLEAKGRRVTVSFNVTSVRFSFSESVDAAAMLATFFDFTPSGARVLAVAVPVMLAFSLVVVDVFVDTDEARLAADTFEDAAPRPAIFELMATVVFAFPFVASTNASRLRFPETVTVFRIVLSCWPSAVLGRVVVAVPVVTEGLRGPEESFALFLEILSTAMDDFVVLALASAPTRAGAFSSLVGLVTRVGRRV